MTPQEHHQSWVDQMHKDIVYLRARCDRLTLALQEARDAVRSHTNVNPEDVDPWLDALAERLAEVLDDA
jgi:hypothetical protein